MERERAWSDLASAAETHARYGACMEAVTHLYTYPEALEAEKDRSEVDAGLAKLSAKLELPHTLKLKGTHSGRITVPDTTPAETWAAIERVVPNWPDLFLPPSAR